MVAGQVRGLRPQVRALWPLVLLTAPSWGRPAGRRRRRARVAGRARSHDYGGRGRRHLPGRLRRPRRGTASQVGMDEGRPSCAHSGAGAWPRRSRRRSRRRPGGLRGRHPAAPRPQLDGHRPPPLAQRLRDLSPDGVLPPWNLWFPSGPLPSSPRQRRAPPGLRRRAALTPLDFLDQPAPGRARRHARRLPPAQRRLRRRRPSWRWPGLAGGTPWPASPGDADPSEDVARALSGLAVAWTPP